MTTIKSISQWPLAVLVVFAGVIHFISPNFSLKIMPPYLPLHLELVYLSGVFEMVLGICLLIPRSSRFKQDAYRRWMESLVRSFLLLSAIYLRSMLLRF